MINLGRKIMASVLAVLMACNVIMCDARSAYAAPSSDEGTSYQDDTATLYSKKIVSVSLGEWHSAAVTKDGELYMWGDNRYGQLGDGTTEDKSTPV
ncbi:MAG: hypothetical protein ACI4GD_02385, partial [Lachnospiraceae bacterium]